MAMKTWYQLRMYWKHWLLARHRRGHGVHSPLVFDLITKVIEETLPYYCYDDIEESLAQEPKKNALSAGAAQLMFRLLHYWHPDDYRCWMRPGDCRRDAYLKAAQQATKGSEQSPDLAITFQAIQSSDAHLAMMVDLSSYPAEQLSHLYGEVEACLQEARRQNKAVMLILLHPHGRKHQRQLWRKMRQDLQCPMVLDGYDLAILMDAKHLPTFDSKVVYA